MEPKSPSSIACSTHSICGSAGESHTCNADANGDLTSGDGRTLTWTCYNAPNTVSDDK